MSVRLRRVDFLEAAQVACQSARSRLDGRSAEVLEQIVVRMHTVERCQGGMRFVEIPEQVADKVRKRFRGGHDSFRRWEKRNIRRSSSPGLNAGRVTPTTAICQWSIKGSSFMPGTLFVVATPIGNLEDITGRALRVLREVGLIAAEDTRRTARLLRSLRHQDPNDQPARAQRVQENGIAPRSLRRGEHLALVSDAGTPTVSDPGQRFVNAALEAGFRVESVPGPSAALAALAASGFPASTFTFLGFPPIRLKDQYRVVRSAAQRSSNGGVLRGSSSDSSDARTAPAGRR